MAIRRTPSRFKQSAGLRVKVSGLPGNAPRARAIAAAGCARHGLAALRGAVLLGALALAGCGGGVGTLLVDPGQYDAYHCKDLTQQWDLLNTREKTLHALMARARQATGGAVIGAMTYQTELDTIAAKRKLVQQQAAEKKCELTTAYQSDQDIH